MDLHLLCLFSMEGYLFYLAQLDIETDVRIIILLYTSLTTWLIIIIDIDFSLIWLCSSLACWSLQIYAGSWPGTIFSLDCCTGENKAVNNNNYQLIIWLIFKVMDWREHFLLWNDFVWPLCCVMLRILKRCVQYIGKRWRYGLYSLYRNHCAELSG